MLVGRDRERRALERLLDEARDGRSGVLALVGEPGIGKSALLDCAAERAVGMQLLRARAVQSEAQIPFAGLFELLRPALGCLEAIPGPQAAALESALALRPARSEDRFAVGAATLSLLAAHAENEPLAVLVDDAHWLDGSSADAILFAARRLVADSVAIVLTARAGESSLLDGADLPTLWLQGLDATAAAQLLRRVAPDTADETVARLYRETGGNPLALLELEGLRLPELPLDTPVPVATSVADAYLQRSLAFPERTRDVLVLAAAADRGELALLARAAAALGLAADDLAPAEETGLVSVHEGHVEFRHPLVRSAVYAGAGVQRRREVHRALADALPDSDADRRAWHLALAVNGPDEAASSALEQAAIRARDRSAYDVASRAFERAAQLSPTDGRRGSMLYAAADASWLGGLPERAVSLLEETGRATSDEALSLEVAHLRGRIALRLGPLQEGRRFLLAAAERAAGLDAALAVLLLAEAAQGAFYSADAADMRALGERAAELAPAGDERSAFFAQITLGMALVLSGEGERGAAAIREAVRVLEREPELSSDPHLLVWAAMGPLWLREAGHGHGLVDRALATARAVSAAGILPHLLLHVGIEQAASDRWVEAEAGYGEAIRLAGETGQRVVLAGALSRLAWLEARLGRQQASRAHAAEALTIARGLGAVLYELWALAALGELELALGEAEAALACLAEQQAVITRHGIADVDVSPAPEQVELYLRLGRREAAAAAAEPFERAAEAKGQPWARARAARCRALLADEESHARWFEEALDLHAATPDVFEAARTELAFGARLRRDGRRSDARERLRHAIDVFDGLGAAPWAELARTELAATGETARRRDPSSLDELTPQELQVSLLLAEGRTTREAAASLFLSPKTIEYHLRNAYRKLGIHSRDELRQALRSHPAAPEPVRQD
jgi:DNA-binding CsgD family transcriptional regulator